jgi:glycerol-3-phosphate dehydrogenase
VTSVQAEATGEARGATGTVGTGVAGLDGVSFDAVVVGGGVLGAGVAREFSRRGLDCLLVERWDFGWGTTARSTRLIHGGLRYLANYDFGLVREGLRERAWQLRVAPNLVTRLPFILPFYTEPLWKRLQLRAGLTLYDLLSPWGSLPRHRGVGRAELARIEPTLSQDGLKGAAMYWDAQVELPERLVIDALRVAADAGSTVRNHVRPTGLVHDAGSVTALELTSETTGERAVVRTARIVNASGPWADETLAAMGIHRPSLMRLNQGIHLVYPRLAEHAIAFEHPDDGRLCFMVPWQGGTMVGTTETDIATIGDAAIRPSEVEYLARATRARFRTPDAERPLWGIVGVRSLINTPGRANKVSRRHVLVDHAVDDAHGLVTVAGGKLTAWRSIAAEVVDDVLGSHDRDALRPDPIGDPVPSPVPTAGVGGASAAAERLWRLYGSHAGEVEAVAATDPWWGEPLLTGQPAIRAEIVHAVEREWAVTLADLVHRRLMLGFGSDLGRGAAEAIAAVCHERLGWDEGRVSRELVEFDRETAERRLPIAF